MTLALRAGRLVNAKRHKYGVAPKEERTVDGVVFASKKEAVFYQQLMVFKRRGEIDKLVLQPTYKFPMGFSYRGDFEVVWRSGYHVVYEVKGVATPVYRLKRKCMAFFYPAVKIVEIRGKGDAMLREM